MVPLYWRVGGGRGGKGVTAVQAAGIYSVPVRSAPIDDCCCKGLCKGGAALLIGHVQIGI